MKKSMLLSAVLAGSLGVSFVSVQADLLSDALDSFNRIKDFNDGMKQRKDDMQKAVAQVKKLEGEEKIKAITRLLNQGVGFVDDLSAILVSVFSTLGGALQQVPVDKVKEVGRDIDRLIYLTDQDKKDRKLTGSVGTARSMLATMKGAIGILNKALQEEKAKQEEALLSAKEAAKEELKAESFFGEEEVAASQEKPVAAKPVKKAAAKPAQKITVKAVDQSSNIPVEETLTGGIFNQ